MALALRGSVLLGVLSSAGRSFVCRSLSLGHLGSQFRAQGCELFLIEEEQLIGIELLALLAEGPLQKFREPMFELRDLLLLLLHRGSLLRDDGVMLRDDRLLLQTQLTQSSNIQIRRQRIGVLAHVAKDA